MKLPFWATREFRILVGVFIMAGAAIAVLVFEILPRGVERKIPPRVGPSRLPVDPNLPDVQRRIEDLTPIEDLDPSYGYMLSYASKVPADVLAEEARPIDFAVLQKAPELVRGRPVSVTALFLESRLVDVAGKAEGIDFVHRVYLMDPGGNEGFVADLIEEPPAGLRKKDVVALEGIYFKLVTYEANKAHRDDRARDAGALEIVRTAAWILGRNLRKVPQRAQPAFLDMPAVLVVAAALSVGLLVFTGLVWSKARRRGGVEHTLRLRPRGAVPRAEGRAAAPVPRRGPPAHWRLPRREPHPAPEGSRGPGRTGPGAGQRRSMGLWIVAAALACTALLGYTLYRELSPGGPAFLDFDTEAEKAFAAAGAAHQGVLAMTRKVWERGEKLGREDFGEIRARHSILAQSADRLLELLEAVRLNKGAEAQAAVAREASRLRRIQLWVLDASDVAESEAEAAAKPHPGFFIPFNVLEEKRKQAQAELADLEKLATQDPTTKPRAAARAAELEPALAACRDGLARLEAYLKEGQLLENLTAEQLSEVAALRAAQAAVTGEIARAEGMAGGQPAGPAPAGPTQR